MITREEALAYLDLKLGNRNIIKHLIASEAMMCALYDFFVSQGKKDLGGTREEWQMTGLLHDGDYVEGVSVEKQGVTVSEWLRQDGYELPDNVAHAMAAHNSDTGVKAESLMDWSIYCGDSLTGLVAATALVLPDKKLANVTPDMVLRRFKEKGFARGSRREDIALCEGKMGLKLEEFVEICLKAMQKVSDQLGL